MQPYQAATEEVRRQSQKPTQLFNTAASVAGSVVGGGAIASRILPLINKFVPGEIMRKGLAKVNPRLGKFVDAAINSGYSLDDIRSFMEEKFSPEEEKVEQNQQSSNILQDFENNYPMLAKGLMDIIQQGRAPQEAAIILKKSTALGSQVKDVEKKSGKKFEDFVIELLGNNAPTQQPAPQTAQPMETQQPQQMQQQVQTQGGVDPQLLQLINQLRGSMKGRGQ